MEGSTNVQCSYKLLSYNVHTLISISEYVLTIQTYKHMYLIINKL